jgi:hypothetical protein
MPRRASIRGFSGWVLGAFLVVAAPAYSQDDAVQRANHMAYDASMKCFVVDTRLAALRKRAGDDVKAVYYDDRSKAAFDAAVVWIGVQQGPP